MKFFIVTIGKGGPLHKFQACPCKIRKDPAGRKNRFSAFSRKETQKNSYEKIKQPDHAGLAYLRGRLLRRRQQ